MTDRPERKPLEHAGKRRTRGRAARLAAQGVSNASGDDPAKAAPAQHISDVAHPHAGPLSPEAPRRNERVEIASPPLLSDTAPPDDQQLTDLGLGPEGAGRILLIACGALAREILDLKSLNGWDHIDLACLPAILHNHPERIAPRVEEAVRKHQARYTKIYVVYADCGTGGDLGRVCADLGVQMIAGPHCYAFFDGLRRFEQRDEITAFYLTDFLVRQFDAFVWRPLGLDRHPELLPMYFGHYETLVYLAQTEDAVLDDRAQEAAQRLGLVYERRMTGYGDLATRVADWAKAD